MDLDIELIREIKTQPVLYDPNDPMYKDTDFKHKIWLEIGKKILDNKDESTAVSALKVRWKSLRDAYVKERKYDLAQTYGMKLRPKKPWRLKRQMEFLAPFIQMRKDFSGGETNSVPRVKNTKTPKTNINTTNYAPVPQMVRENDLAFNYDMNLFNQCIPKTNDQRFIEIDSFFRDIANAVKGLSPNSQVMLEKDITNLVMNYKLKELSDVRGLNG